MIRTSLWMLFGQACFAAEASSTSCASSHPEDSERTVLLQRSPATHGLSDGVMEAKPTIEPQVSCIEDVKLYISNAFFHEQLSETHDNKIETSDEFGLWQRFTLEDAYDEHHSVFIVSPTGKYLSDHKGKLMLKDKGQAWEVWKVSAAGNGNVYLTSHRDQHLADKYGHLYMSDNKGGWETWKVSTWLHQNMCDNKTTFPSWYSEMFGDSAPPQVQGASSTVVNSSSPSDTASNWSTVEQNFTIASYNVYYNNHDYKAQAKVILDSLKAEIVNIQEGIKDMVPDLVEQLNLEASEGSWALANPWHHKYHWCGLTTYRSDIWELQDHWEVGFKQTWDTRGVCGALLQRKIDGLKLCVWGTHPIWRRASSWWGRHAIQNAAFAMKECSSKGGRSLFMGDLNTRDTNAIRKELDHKTGMSWKLAFGYGYDQIYAETSPSDVGVASKGACVSPGGRKGCGWGCRKAEWGRSDHPPVSVQFAPGLFDQ